MLRTSTLLSLEDFQALYEREGAFEILHGEAMPPSALLPVMKRRKGTSDARPI